MYFQDGISIINSTNTHIIFTYVMFLPGDQKSSTNQVKSQNLTLNLNGRMGENSV